jgi:hypothetical protein
MDKKYILKRIKVADYDKWHMVYSQGAVNRLEAGIRELHLFRNRDFPNEISVLSELKDLDKAKEFMGSKELAERMKDAGVIEVNNFIF